MTRHVSVHIDATEEVTLIHSQGERASWRIGRDSTYLHGTADELLDLAGRIATSAAQRAIPRLSAAKAFQHAADVLTCRADEAVRLENARTDEPLPLDVA